MKPFEAGRCRDCRHFDGSAEGVEAAFPGLATLSSGWASVRAEDGLCGLLGLYLPGGDGCARQAPAVRPAPGPGRGSGRGRGRAAA